MPPLPALVGLVPAPPTTPEPDAPPLLIALPATPPTIVLPPTEVCDPPAPAGGVVPPGLALSSDDCDALHPITPKTIAPNIIDVKCSVCIACSGSLTR
jgi:hypothetical protein